MPVILVLLTAIQAVIFVAANLTDDIPPVCNVTCEATFNQSLIADASLWVHPDITLDPFYATPDNLSEYAVGDLVKWENLGPEAVSAQWSIPSGLALFRFYYVSEDLVGNPLPATAYVLIPYSNPLGPYNPFRVVVWAHGTAGFTPQCAPSNNKGLQYNWQAPFALAQQGYVVIAPDYAGQGSNIPQGFMYNAGILHAADVSLAVVATRNSLPVAITEEWVVVGHSEGGLTAWRTAQREAIPVKAAGGFIGAVSIAPAMEVMNLVPWVIKKAHGGPLNEIFLPFMLQSIRRLFPSIDLSEYVTEKLLRLSQLASRGCLNVAIPLLAPLTLDDMYLNGANFTSAPEVLDWDENYHGKGAYELGGPMLVLHGGADFILPPSNTERVFMEQCEAYPESLAEYIVLPGLDHDGVVQASHSTYFPWIANRFNHKPLSPGCTMTQAEVATDKFSTVEQVWISGGQVLVQ